MAKSRKSAEITLEYLLECEDIEPELSRLSFEEGLKLLDQLVSDVESGNLALEKAVRSYERGVQLVKRLRMHLSGAEQKLKILGADGELVEAE